MNLLYVGLLFIGVAIGMVLMGLMCASGQTHRCEECRRREPKEGGGFHIGSHKELF